MRVVAFRGTGLHFQVVDVAVQGLRQLVDELRHAEGPHVSQAALERLRPVATRNDERPDAQSSPIFDAR